MSTLRANALEGMDAKNSMTIVAGAGNIITTNVQQGLVKARWTGRTDGTISPTGYESFNIASITDVGTAEPRCSYTNSMNSATYGAVAGGWGYNDWHGTETGIGTLTTASFKLYHAENNTARDANQDASPLTGAILGELA